ncbi:LacI family DNA-binding transcriptional regulator [Bifidobacterium oedipodis]|uniref:LacI family transcriptional regulator n=1 Tax=Bifidobacterium oedipodis TaxID=2675322 RepID=A0A7Y0EQK8_9BIFI|nr:LacI family DNA-binding transcriptional regulator [Bifidobacterium sp. DSM 109957]NMM94567.1 LacI family transcriptional regulator [Bifidobacterium sp. DSM 109957]
MGVTLRDVAARAGVSVSTAGAALRGESIVKEVTKTKVLEAAEALRYVPNAQARALSTGSSGIIAVIVPELIHGYYARLIDEIAYEAPKHGFQACFYQTGYGKDSELELVRRIGQPVCDGFILNLNSNFDADIKAITGDKPAVLLNSFSETPVLDCIQHTNVQKYEAAFAYLIGRGYQHVAVIGLDVNLFEGDDMTGRVSSARTVLDCLRRHRLGDENDCFACDWAAEDGRDVAQSVLESGKHYDVCLCMNDLIAEGLIRGFADHGFSVPGDIAVFGSDDIRGTEYAVPSLSTIGVDYHDTAVKALDMLVARIRGTQEERNAPPHVEHAAFHLRARESA